MNELEMDFENTYRLLIENLPQRIFQKDSNSVYLDCNQNFADAINLPKDQIIGKTTSAGFGFRIGKPVCLADVAIQDSIVNGMRVEVNIGGDVDCGAVSTNPVFDPDGDRMKG